MRVSQFAPLQARVCRQPAPPPPPPFSAGGLLGERAEFAFLQNSLDNILLLSPPDRPRAFFSSLFLHTKARRQQRIALARKQPILLNDGIYRVEVATLQLRHSRHAPLTPLPFFLSLSLSHSLHAHITLGDKHQK